MRYDPLPHFGFVGHERIYCPRCGPVYTGHYCQPLPVPIQPLTGRDAWYERERENVPNHNPGF
jgi:hypothetical protein